METITFKFRAECLRDVLGFLTAVGTHNSNSHDRNLPEDGLYMQRIEIKTLGDTPGDDRVVELDIRKIPGRQRAWTEEVLVTDLRDLMDSVPDGHVMAETVQQFDKYTGERVPA